MVAEVVSGLAQGLLGGFFGQQANANGIMMSYEQQKKLMQDQAKINWKYYTKDLLEKYKLGRQGLEAANYNPMLVLGGVQGNSSWASQASINDTGAGTAFNSGMANATQMNAVRQQGNLIDSQVNNNNADSVLKENQAMTELYNQLEKSNHADLMQAQKTLTDKNVSWYDKQQAREDLRVANEIKRTGNDFKVGMAQAIASQMQANNSHIVALSNAQDVKSRLPVNKEEAKIRKWNAKHPVLSRILPGTASSGISAGATLIK